MFRETIKTLWNEWGETLKEKLKEIVKSQKDNMSEWVMF